MNDAPTPTTDAAAVNVEPLQGDRLWDTSWTQAVNADYARRLERALRFELRVAEHMKRYNVIKRIEEALKADEGV